MTKEKFLAALENAAKANNRSVIRRLVHQQTELDVTPVEIGEAIHKGASSTTLVSLVHIIQNR